MRNKLQLPIAACLVILAVLSSNLAWSAEPSPDETYGVPIDLVINAIRDSLIEAQLHNVPLFPKLKGVTITLQTAATNEKGGVFKLLIFSLDTRKQSEAASTLTLKMIPPPTVNLKSGEEAEPETLKNALAQAITIAKIGALNANVKAPKLDLSKVEIEIKFAVEASHGQGLDTAKLLPIGVQGTRKLKTTHVHTVKLEFGTDK